MRKKLSVNDDVNILRLKKHGKCIYKLESPSGKVYIGQTWDFNRRMNQYENISDRVWESDRSIAKAIRKYGFESFSVSILVDNVETQEELNELEIKYISEYDSYNYGYNQTAGGDILLNPNTGRGIKFMTGKYGVPYRDNPKEYRKAVWENMTEEEKDVVRAKNRERRSVNAEEINRKNREKHRKMIESMTEEELKAFRELEHKKSKYYRDRRTREQKDRLNAHARERIAEMTPEEKRAYLDRKSSNSRRRYDAMSPEEKRAFLDKISDDYFSMSPEEKRAFNRRHRDLAIARFEKLSDEEKQVKIQHRRDLETKRRNAMSPEKKKAKSQKAMENFYKRYNAMTPEEQRAFKDKRNAQARARRLKAKEQKAIEEK